MSQDQNLPIEDVQNTPDVRHLAIDKVGIKSIRHPVKVKDKTGGVQHTVAMFDMYVHLPHNFKGTHMSRFVEILNMNEREISIESFETILREMEAGLNSAAKRKTITISDRKEAIMQAVKLAKPEDIILVAGKGHEKYQDINGVKHHFDDKEILNEIFKALDK